MLATLADVLPKAQKAKYAVGLFNSVNMELARGILSAAEKTGSPVIIGTAEIFLPLSPLEELSYLLLPMAKKASVPVVVHLDHGLTEENCRRALELGFTSIMFDCSREPYEKNVAMTKEMALLAHSFGASIEGELGSIGSNDDSLEDAEAAGVGCFTDPEQARDFAQRTGVDALAIAVGTAHGSYKLPPKLDFDLIEAIRRTIDTPLVLHGGSGLTDDDFRKAVNCGISKINIFTDLDIAAERAAQQSFKNHPNSLVRSLPAVVEAVERETMKKMKLFGLAKF